MYVFLRVINIVGLNSGQCAKIYTKFCPLLSSLQHTLLIFYQDSIPFCQMEIKFAVHLLYKIGSSLLQFSVLKTIIFFL